MTPFPFAPDWSNLVIERLEWVTDVMTSQDGREQRVRLCDRARRSLEYSTLLGTDRERALAEHLMHASQAVTIALPFWLDTAWLTDPLPASGSTAFVDATADRDLVVGAEIALVDGIYTETAEVQSVAPTAVDLVVPATAAWPAGTKLVPLVAARLQPTMVLSYLSDAVGRATLQFTLEDRWNGAAAAESADYRGYSVLTPQTNWTQDPTAEFRREIDVFDPVVGARVYDDANGITQVERSHRWLLQGRAAIAGFRAWLAARAGRLVPFWLPSNQADVKVLASVSGAATTITVENRGYAQLFDSTDDLATIGRRDIMVLSGAGVRYYRRIVAATVIDRDTEQLTLNAALGVALSPAQIERVSFMRLVRLAADSVELAHHTDAVAEVALALASVRDDA